MKVSFPSKYLKQEDCREPLTLMIKSVNLENVARDGTAAEEKYVIRFQETSKGMVLNSVNFQRLVKATGSNDSDAWIGRQIIVYTDEEVSFGGKQVGGLRVRFPKPQGVVKSLPDDPFTDQDFPPLEEHHR